MRVGSLRSNSGELRFSNFVVLSTFFLLLSLYIVQTSRASFGHNTSIDIINLPLELLNIFIPSLLLSYSLSQRDPLLNMAFFWMFQFLFFGISGLLSVIDPFPYYLTQASSAQELRNASKIIFIANLIVALSQIYVVKKAASIEEKVIEPSIIDLDLVIKRTHKVFNTYLFFAPFIILQLGGPDFLFKRVRLSGTGPDLAISINAILQTVLYVPPLIMLLALLYSKQYRKISYWKLRILFIWLLFLSNPLGNARQTTLFLILPIVFYFLHGKRRLVFFFFSMLPFVFLYGAGLVNRYTGKIQAPRLAITSRNGDFDSFSQIANGIQAVSQGVFPIFQQGTASIFFFVPRSIFEGKPVDTGVELAKFLGLRFQNLSAPWILEAYVNLRLPGVLIVSLLLGYFVTKSDLLSRKSLNNFLISSITSGFLFILLRGSLLQATGRIIFSFALLYVILRNTKPKFIKSAPH
jgi:hypothetical protein